MAERNDHPYIVIERRSAGVTPFFWGALVGAGVALLLAPRSGQETTRQIRRRADAVRDSVNETITRARSRLHVDSRRRERYTAPEGSPGLG